MGKATVNGIEHKGRAPPRLCRSFSVSVLLHAFFVLMLHVVWLVFRFSSLFILLILLSLVRLRKRCICVHNLFLFRDLNKVDEGIGHKIGMLLQAITTVLVGFIMGFVYGWKLTLVMIAASPLVVIAGGIIGKVTS